MKNAGMAAAMAGVFTTCLAIASEPVALEAGAVGIAVAVAGFAMVLYQSYKDEEAAEQARRRKKLFWSWCNGTDLKKEKKHENRF